MKAPARFWLLVFPGSFLAASWLWLRHRFFALDELEHAHTA